MDGLTEPVRECLLQATSPMTATEVAEIVATVADRVEVQGVLRNLIRRERVARHHCSDGVLRYSWIGPKLAMSTKTTSSHGDTQVTSLEPETYIHHEAVRTATVPRKHRTRRRRASPKQDRILELLGDRAMTADEILQSCNGEFTAKQVKNLLSMMRLKRLVNYSAGRKPRWHAMAGKHGEKPRVFILMISDVDFDAGSIATAMIFDPPMEDGERETPASRAATLAMQYVNASFPSGATP